jgi:RNA polymerase sigma-70 factor (ECF subfamily)
MADGQDAWVAQSEARQAETRSGIELERAMVARAKQRDPEAVSWIYERYAPMVRRYVSPRIGDATLAEDICNDVFVRVLESIERYEDRGWPLSAWLYRIAYARTMDILRQRRRRQAIPLDDSAIDPGESFDERVLAHIAYIELQELMDILTSDQRMVLQLRFDEQRSLAEVAQSLGRSVGSVKALQHRGLARLAEALALQPGYAPAM